MEYQDIKRLIQDMGDSKLSYLDIEFPEGTKISMKKEQITTAQKGEPVINQEIETKVIYKGEELSEGEENKTEGNYITSPMVGTFYSKSSPDAQPFVEVGDSVKKGDVLCIIEAMKLMNEIEAEQDGVIAEVLVKDGEMVDYAKPLFRIN